MILLQHKDDCPVRLEHSPSQPNQHADISLSVNDGARSRPSLSYRHRPTLRLSGTNARGIYGPRRYRAGGDVAVLFLEDQPEVPAGWQLLRGGTLVQMVCPTIPDQPPLDDPIV